MICTYVIPEARVDVFQWQMLKGADIGSFQQKTLLHIPEQKVYQVSYSPWNSEHVSVADLLSRGFFETPQLADFFQQAREMQRTIEDFLLDAERIVYHPDAIYCNPAERHYYWQYIPESREGAHYGTCELIRHMLIETAEHTGVRLEHLKRENLSFACAAHVIREETGPSEPQGFFQSLFKTAKQTATPATSYESRGSWFPMLIDRGDTARSHAIYFEKNTVGSAANSNILLSHPSICPKHALISRCGRSISIEPLSSSGTLALNGIPLTGKKEIVNGDILQMGFKEYVFLE